jgi:putative peptidoglycan lipid II flippase
MSLAKRAFTVSSWTLLSRVLGLVRDRLWAGVMGGSQALDAFLVAFALPNMLRELFGDGALAQAFIPRYVQLKEKDPAEAERFAGAVLGRLTLLLAAIALLFMAGAGAVAFWSGPGSKESLVAVLALPMIPYLVFICLVAMMAGMLNGRRRFWAAAAMPAVLNVVLISTVWLSPESEARILPWAVLGAGVLQVSFMLLALRLTGGVPRFSLRSTPEERDLRRAIMPVVVSASVYQINALIGQVLAYKLLGEAGAVAYLYFGNRLLQFPLAMIGHGVTTAAYPEISSRAAQGWAAVGEGLRAATGLLSFWLLPAAVGLLVTAEPLVRAIYQTGHFTEAAVFRTVLVTQVLALALVPISLQKLLLRGFHASRDQRTPMHVSLAMVGLNFVLSVALILTPLKEAGLALATALSSFAGCATYAVLLRRRGAGTVVPLRPMLRPAFAALVMGAAVWCFLIWWPQPPGRASLYAVGRLGAAVALGGAIYLALTGIGWLRKRREANGDRQSQGQG